MASLRRKDEAQLHREIVSAVAGTTGPSRSERQDESKTPPKKHITLEADPQPLTTPRPDVVQIFDHSPEKEAHDDVAARSSSCSPEPLPEEVPKAPLDLSEPAPLQDGAQSRGGSAVTAAGAEIRTGDFDLLIFDADEMVEAVRGALVVPDDSDGSDSNDEETRQGLSDCV